MVIFNSRHFTVTDHTTYNFSITRANEAIFVGSSLLVPSQAAIYSGVKFVYYYGHMTPNPQPEPFSRKRIPKN